MEHKKAAILRELIEKIRNYESLFVVDYTGVEIRFLNKLRLQVEAANSTILITKNTLIKKILPKLHFKNIEDRLSGPNLFIATNDLFSVAKIIEDSKKKLEKRDLKTLCINCVTDKNTIMEQKTVFELGGYVSRENLQNIIITMIMEGIKKKENIDSATI